MSYRQNTLSQINEKVTALLDAESSTLRAATYCYLIAPVRLHPWIVALALITVLSSAALMIKALIVGLFALAALSVCLCYVDKDLRAIVERVRARTLAAQDGTDATPPTA
jgi:hypothetical protein